MHALTSADLFRAVWPQHTAKRAAQAAAGPVSTAKAWVQRRYRPDADTLLRMAKESAELRAELVRLLGEWDAALVPVAAGEVLPPAGDSAGQAGRCAGSAAQADAAGVATQPWDGTERRKQWC